ncbi:MAG: SprT family zinc-dependent metalloprotease [Coriobacteriia bacterium]|nr:SprT family zinc-dependent metalloprotease [Coriobacteriia bacterium]
MAFSEWTTPARPGSGSGRGRGRGASGSRGGRGAAGGRQGGSVSSRGSGAAAAADARLEFVDDLEVWVIRKCVKNLNLRVTSPDARIEVSAPYGTPDQVIFEFVRQKRPWILQHQERVLNSTMARADGASKAEVEEWRRLVKAFAPPLVAKWEPVLGVRAQKLAFRNMTSRWGSCQPSTGRICLNIRLALYPPECLEYVVVHELCHLRVSGHGPAFWALVEACLPNYRDARAKLGE